ncbi:unnamed protein product, partial [Amoebophrya sp. A25]
FYTKNQEVKKREQPRETTDQVGPNTTNVAERSLAAKLMPVSTILDTWSQQLELASAELDAFAEKVDNQLRISPDYLGNTSNPLLPKQDLTFQTTTGHAQVETRTLQDWR